MQLTPYIIFNGECEEALNFYARALGGVIRDMTRYENAPEGMTDVSKQKIMHARFAADGNLLFMASDDGKGGGKTDAGSIQLSLNFDNRARMENIFASMSEGGKVSMPLQDTFWGARFGMLQDRFGINWMFNCESKRQS